MNYLDYYELNQEPFSNAPVSRFYFNSPQHSQALVRLTHLCGQMKGLGILVGDIGAGKTTLARRLLDSLPEAEYEAALLVIIHSGVTASWLLKRIALQLGVEAPSEDKLTLLGQLYQRLIKIYESGKKAVVLIDEAQMLATRELMEEFRGLLNLEVPERKLLSLIFFGLPEIEQNLRLDPPLAQRVSIKFRLEHLNPESTESYIKHRLRLAGASRMPFTGEAVKGVHRFSGGTPRLINTLCDNALFEGYVARAPPIDQAAIALLRTEYVGTNLCGYAIATIEEASAAKVRVDRCTVDPTRGQLVIDGLTVGDPGGRLEVRAARVFVQVIVRPLLQRVRLERLEIDHAEVKLALDQSGPARPRGAADHQCLPHALDRFELGRVQVRKASLTLISGGRELLVPRVDAQVHGKDDALQVSLRTAGGSVRAGQANVAITSLHADAKVDLRGRGKLELTEADLRLADASALVRGTLADLCQPKVEGSATVHLDDLGALSQQMIPGKLAGVGGSLAADVTFALARGKPRASGDLRLHGGAIEGFLPGDLTARFEWTPARLSIGNFELPVGRGGVT